MDPAANFTKDCAAFSESNFSKNYPRLKSLSQNNGLRRVAENCCLRHFFFLMGFIRHCLPTCQRASPMARAFHDSDTWSIAGLLVQHCHCWHGLLSTACPRYPSVGYVDSTSAVPTPCLSGFRGAIRSVRQSLNLSRRIKPSGGGLARTEFEKAYIPFSQNLSFNKFWEKRENCFRQSRNRVVAECGEVTCHCGASLHLHGISLRLPSSTFSYFTSPEAAV